MAGESHWNPDSQRWEPGPEPVAYPRYDAGDGAGNGTKGEAEGGDGGPSGLVPPPPEFAPGLPAPDTELSFRIGGGEADDGEPPDPGRRAPVVAIVAAAVAAVGIAATLWFTVGPGDEDGKPTAGPSASAAASSGESTTDPSASPSDSASDDPYFPSDEPSADPSPSDSASTGTAAAPDGYRVTTDPEGFTLAVPEDWSRTTVGASVFYTSSDGTALVQIFEITEPGYTPADAVDYANKDLARRAADYKERSVGPVSGGPENPSGDAAELVYAYDSAETGGVRECVERVFTATDDTIYAVLTCASAEQSPLERQLLDTALAHFEP